MKILFLVSGSVRSNFSYRPLALARSLHTMGHDVSIIAPRADKYNHFVSERITNIDGVRVLQPFQFTTTRLEINLLPYVFGAIRMLLCEKPDLVYIYKATPISIVGLLSKLIRNTEIVGDFDDLGSEVMRVEGHPLYQRKLVEWCEKLVARYADKIVVASYYLKEMYIEQFPNKPVHLMPNGAESSWFVPTVPTENAKKIVFMGSINRKNILEPLFESLPQIIQKHPDVVVEIIGDGNYLQYFKEKTRTLGVSDHVTFTGWLKIEDAQQRLHAGDIGYSYMPYEDTTRAASNMKVPQYMARGVVPLVSDVGDLPIVVDRGRSGYICATSGASALSDCLMEALGDQGRMQKAGHARHFALEELNWNTLANGFIRWIIPRNEGSTPQIYVIATSIPGNVGGGEIRNLNMIDQLQEKLGAHMTVFCISGVSGHDVREHAETGSDVSTEYRIVPGRRQTFFISLKALIKRIPPFMEAFRASGIDHVFRRACEESLPDVVHIEQLHAYYCIRPHIRWLKSRDIRIVLDCHNVESQAFEDSLAAFHIFKKLIGKYLFPRIKALEVEAARCSDIVLACSYTDASFFRQYNSRTCVVPNGVDCSMFRATGNDGEPTVIFMGGVGYPPNADALQYYLTQIHLKVKERVPGVKLLTIGCDRDWLQSIDIHDDSVRSLGFVDDVRPYLHQAMVGICPIRYGSGTRIKIMTYMAAGLPVVSTTKGAEGVNYTNGQNIVLADDPISFSDAIFHCLKDVAYRNKIAQNGQNFVLKNYDWNIVGKELVGAYSSLYRI